MRFFAVAICLVVSAACGGQSAPAGPEEAEGPPAAILGEEGDIPLTTLDGEAARLKDFGSRVTVIAMWATWCSPCLDELPYLEELHQLYEDREDVSVLAVNVDVDSQHPEVRALVEELGLTLPVLLDGEQVLERLVEGGQKRLPLLAIVTPGFDVHRESGFAPGIPREEYLASKSTLIDAALEGRDLPASSRPAAGGMPAAGSTIKMKLPVVEDPTEEKIQSMLGELREAFNQSYPEMSGAKLDALLEKVEEALRAGDRTVELQL